MARNAVFDPTDTDLFNQQRQRFDWSLLKNGNVFRYDTRFHLDSTCTRLVDLGYLVHRIDGDGWTSIEDMYDAFAQAMSYDPGYGRGPDAFDDCLSEVADFTFGSDPSSTGTVLAVAGFDTVVQLDHHIAQVTLDSFARKARLACLYGHPMLCLVETTATDLGPVGGIDVYRGSLWDSEVDPPEPFGEADLVEYVLLIAANDADAVEYAGALRSIVRTGIFTAAGRWQVLDPVLVSPPATTYYTEDGTKPLPADKQIWKISVGLRGEGDYNTLVGKLVGALGDTGLPRFQQMSSSVYAGGTEAYNQALTRYPHLHDEPGG